MKMLQLEVDCDTVMFFRLIYSFLISAFIEDA